ncbi:MAG: HlyD family secretion protein [Planctomycetales bacterium]|nr:HlyD family secretion protein [Planctomycetales bacterium]
MMWLLGALYCLVLWLVFAKWRLLRLSLPIAIVAASLGPALILVFLFCAQYYHPFTQQVLVLQRTVAIVPQMKQAGRVTEAPVEPNTPIKAGDVLFKVDPAPFQLAVDRLTATEAEAKQGVQVAEASVEAAQSMLKRATSDLAFMAAERDREEQLIETGAVSREKYEATLTRYEQAAAALDQATIGVRQGELSVEAAKAKLAQATAALADAQYDLDQTVVRAPSDGYVTNLQLEPGALVGGPGATSVMTFLPERKEDQRGVVVAMIGQKNILLVKPEQYAEVVLNAYPGCVFKGRVLNVIEASGAGQLTPSGDLPENVGSGPPTKFAVRIRLDDAAELRLPPGAAGAAAIYTDNVPVAGIPAMVVLRMQSWLKYLF